MNNQAAQTMPDIDAIVRHAINEHCPNGKWLTGTNTLAMAITSEVTAALSQTAGVVEPGRYFASGPQGHFFADDLQLARDLVNLYDKDDDWTITDLRNPTGAAPAASGGEDGPIFHLRSYGDVTEAELKKYTAPVTRPANGEVVAWMHDDGKEIHIITDKIKSIWLAANEVHVEHYNIPLYSHPKTDPQPPSAASVSERARVSLDLNNLPAEWPWDEGSPCLAPRPVGMVYPAVPTPRAFGYLDKTGVEWAAYDTGQMEEYGRRAFADGANTALRAIEQALTQQRACATCGGRGEIGGHVGQTAETFDYVTEPCPECTTPQPSADAVRELVKRWRELSVKSHRDGQYQGHDTLRLCADELESLLSAARDHQQNAAQGGGSK